MKAASALPRVLCSAFALSLVVFAALVQACGGDEQAGQACEAASECYPDIDPADLKGDVLCLAEVPGGYCTHLCETDDDCCAVDGECQTGHPQVCAPFQATGKRMCFLSCEADVLGDEDEEGYCQKFANDAFVCRSTGGGAENRKVCAQ